MFCCSIKTPAENPKGSPGLLHTFDSASPFREAPRRRKLESPNRGAQTAVRPLLIILDGARNDRSFHPFPRFPGVLTPPDAIFFPPARLRRAGGKKFESGGVKMAIFGACGGLTFIFLFLFFNF